MGSGYLLGWELSWELGAKQSSSQQATKWVKVIDNDTGYCSLWDYDFYTIMIYFKIICSSEPETGQGSFLRFIQI